MNLPNKLTIVRLIIIPFFLILMVVPFDWGSVTFWGATIPVAELIAAILFIAATITDNLDGRIARRDHLVTNFGKFMDPLADKLLVCSALICLVALTKIPAWIVIIIIAREFIISGFRLIASDNGVVIAASYWGKFKTTFQMVMICLMIADIEAISLITTVVMWIALILTIVSLVDYLIKNKDVMKDTK